MHVLGKVLMWFALPLIITAMVFTTMLLDVRSNWKKKLEVSLVAAQKSTDDLRIERTKTESLISEKSALQHNWGEAWMANNSGPQGANGIIDIGVGTGNGLGQKSTAQNKPLANVFVFGQNGQESQFLGEFKLLQARADSATGQLVRTIYPGEEATWPNGTYRVRDTLPLGWVAATNEIDGQILIAQRYLAEQQEQLAILTKQVEESQKTLDQRKQELNGDPTALEGAEPEVVNGLVATVRSLELERNAVLARVDQLRHDMNDSYVLLRETMDANSQMSKKLSEAAAVSIETATPALTARPTVDQK